MVYTPQERLVQLWKLAEEDPECVACQAEMQQTQQLLEDLTEGMSKEDSLGYWGLPACIHTYFGRVLELASREMRFPEEIEG